VTVPTRTTIAAADLTLEIRHLVARYPPMLRGSALAYELAAAVAAAARTPEEADDLLNDLVRLMRQQLLKLGVGHEHP